MRRRLSLLLAALALVPGVALAGEREPDLVGTDAGPVRGTLTDELRIFTGIPYAAPPVGDLRWRSPRPVTPWTTPRKATEPAAPCAQEGTHLGAASYAEDCLYLNVTAPRRPGRRPVLVWLHGGSFQDGAGHLYPAYRMAGRGDVVVVTVNYRLGALGFLAAPVLGEADGNLGLADQQAALRWVRRNAEAFGGDPRDVTLAGESAGGISVCAHLAAPSSAGLFHRAVIQSAPCVGSRTGNDPRSSARAVEQSRKVLAGLGLGPAPTARQLRDPRLVTPRDLLAAASGSAFGPVYGTRLLPADPARSITSGRINRVPVLHGINRDEQRLQVWGHETEVYGGPVPAAEYPAEIERVSGAAAPRVLREYPLSRYASASHALAAVLTDAELAAPTMRTADALSRWVPTFMYEFADSDAPWFTGFPRPYPMGAYHAAELPYLFDVTGSEPLTAVQQRLAERMIGHWAAFARAGDPGWRRSAPGRPAVRGLAPGLGPVDFAAIHRYRFWAGVTLPPRPAG